MYAKLHEKDYKGFKRRVVAVCDAKLLGKVFESNGHVLDLKAYRSFYEGERVTVTRLGEMLEGIENVNLIGEKSIEAASKHIKVSLEKARIIGGVPHLQYYKL